jgi:hypothetical protein
MLAGILAYLHGSEASALQKPNGSRGKVIDNINIKTV